MNVIRLMLTLAIAVLVSACATVEVEGRGSFSPDAMSGSETVHGSLYGFRWKPTEVEKCADDQLFRVETHTNALLLLASVASLGLYVPQTIEWWCTAPTIDEEDEEVWQPGSD